MFLFIDRVQWEKNLCVKLRGRSHYEASCDAIDSIDTDNLSMCIKDHHINTSSCVTSI